MKTTKTLENILNLSSKLIAIKSDPGNTSELETCLNICIEELKEFNVELFERNGNKSALIFNSIKRPDRFKIILNGHLDVIPGKDFQYNPIIKGNKLYGVGALDMKSNLSCLVYVFKEFAGSLPYPLGLQIVTDEEVGGFDGTKYQVEKGVRGDFIISSETTQFNIVNRAKGILWCEILFQGKTAHGAYPWRGDNAILKMNIFLKNLLKKFPIPQTQDLVTTINVANVNSTNRVFNKIPDSATASLDIRFMPGDDKKILKFIEKNLPKNSKLKIITHEKALDTSHKNKYIEILQKTVKKNINIDCDLYCAQGSSDARHFAVIGCAGVEFGPVGGGIGEDEEWIDIHSLQEYHDILADFLKSIS